MITVQFNCKYGRFNTAERAGFPEEEARRLIGAGVAGPVIKPVVPAFSAGHPSPVAANACPVCKGTFKRVDLHLKKKHPAFLVTK